MPSRNYDEYVYWTIAVRRGSAAHRGVLRDAQEVKSKQFPTVAAMALQNYYKGLIPAQQQKQMQIVSDEPALATTSQEKIEENLDEAVDAWG